MRWLLAGLLAGAPWIASAGANTTTAADAIVGFWQTEAGGAVVQIMRSDALDASAAPRYEGRLAWLRESHYPADDPQGMAGQPVADRHNPDAALRERPLQGLTLLTGLRYRHREHDDAQWVDGRVYDTENGKRYDCIVWLADNEHLKLRGYVGIELLGQTTTWTRVPDPAVRPPIGGRP